MVSSDLESMSGNWHWFVLFGILLIILGIVAISYAMSVTAAATLIFGVLLIVSGVLQLFSSFMAKSTGGFFWELLLGLLNIVIGGWIIVQPMKAAIALTLVIAIFLILSGLFKIIMALVMRTDINWFLVLLGGFISVLLGILIYYHWPVSGLWVIGLYVGIDMIMSGWGLLTIGFAAKAAKPS